MNPAIDPVAVGGFVLLAVALAVALTTIWKNVRPDPALHRQFVSREEYERHVAEVMGQLNAIRHDGEDRVRRIHERMDKQTEQIITVIRDQVHQSNNDNRSSK